VTVRILRSLAEVEAIAADWEALSSRAHARPFQTFAWSASWLRTVGATAEYRVAVGASWENERLVAILPLVVGRRRGVRLLQWIGAGASDYCDALIDPSVATSPVLNELWHAYLAEGGFDLARLGQVRTDATIFEFLSSLKPWVETRESASGLDIKWASGQEWIRSQGARTRERINRGLRKMTKAGFVFEVWQPGQPLEPLVQTLIDQKSAWLRQRGEKGFLLDPRGVAFTHELVREFAAAKILHLSCVRSTEAVAAVHLGFMSEGVLYYYIPSFDPQWSKLGLGTLLRESLIMWACDQRLRRFDLTRGEYDYKAQYDPEIEDMRTLVIPRTLIGRAAMSLYRFAVSRRASAAAPSTESAS
jgi:CelD/BcsL family acetyltransferase involved in cellulose biosynthesis